MRTSPFTGTIYVTRLDFKRLTELVRQETPAAFTRATLALERALAQAHLVDSYDILPDVVTMNSRLKLRRMHSREELEFTLVYPPDANDAQSRLSVLSPMGIAVLGCRLGDQVALAQAGGAASYWVDAILHQPEAAGDWVS